MKKVKLYAPTIGVMEFEKDHAERILKKENNGGWVEYKPEVKTTNGVNRSKKGTKRAEK